MSVVAAVTQKIEIGTAVIDMRYENPHYMAEDAGSADLIAGSSQGSLMLAMDAFLREFGSDWPNSGPDRPRQGH